MWDLNYRIRKLVCTVGNCTHGHGRSRCHKRATHTVIWDEVGTNHKGLGKSYVRSVDRCERHAYERMAAGVEDPSL
jgi:hypothetical protein